jgi:hypothetical protein
MTAPTPPGAESDQDDVAQRADHHHDPDVLASQALPHHESVLRADRHDEAEPEAESGEGGGKHGSDATGTVL